MAKGGGYVCERERPMTFEPTYRDGALHMHYALSVIFGQFLIQKIVKFNFKKLSGG